MIKSKNGHIEGKGDDVELLKDLSFIISTLITDGEIDEELIDIAVGLGKAHAKGEENDYMENTLKKRLVEKLKENLDTVEIDLNELMKQIKEEKEENED